jgi:hypothetical protein
VNFEQSNIKTITAIWVHIFAQHTANMVDSGIKEGIRYRRGEIHYSTISNGCERLSLDSREMRVGDEL